jgi:hypothetical protein
MWYREVPQQELLDLPEHMDIKFPQLTHLDDEKPRQYFLPDFQAVSSSPTVELSWLPFVLLRNHLDLETIEEQAWFGVYGTKKLSSSDSSYARFKKTFTERAGIVPMNDVEDKSGDTMMHDWEERIELEDFYGCEFEVVPRSHHGIFARRVRNGYIE